MSDPGAAFAAPDQEIEFRAWTLQPRPTKRARYPDQGPFRSAITHMPVPNGPITIRRWVMDEPGRPLRAIEEPSPELQPGTVLVEVAGCGVCHTDLGFYYDGVRTRGALPLALGHEVSGFVVGAGEGCEGLLGEAVVVPAVIPCGDCAACAAGLGTVCKRQFMPGNDGHGGFASHLVVPGVGLCVVPDVEDADQPLGASGVTLRTLSVLADAASTAWQAVLRADLKPGAPAVVVGCGGVGTCVVQLAAARGAKVIAVDVDAGRLAQAEASGAAATVQSGDDLRAARRAVRGLVKELGGAGFGVPVFECSGAPAGQTLAFEVLGPAGILLVVGYTGSKVPLRLSRLMALDARAVGNWGCLPEHYPALLELALDGTIDLSPLVAEYPLDDVQEVLEAVHAHKITKRPVLIPSRATTEPSA